MLVQLHSPCLEFLKEPQKSSECLQGFWVLGRDGSDFYTFLTRSRFPGSCRHAQDFFAGNSNSRIPSTTTPSHPPQSSETFLTLLCSDYKMKVFIFPFFLTVCLFSSTQIEHYREKNCISTNKWMKRSRKKTIYFLFSQIICLFFNILQFSAILQIFY